MQVEVLSQCIKKPPGDANVHSRGEPLPLTKGYKNFKKPLGKSKYPKIQK
jgi:hypothetical protein